MRINIHTDQTIQETEVNINCSQLTPDIERMISLLRVMDKKLTGVKNGQMYFLDSNQILYIETVDKKTFFYTSEDVYETSLKLYELEYELDGTDFFRSGKSSIIHLGHIKSLKADLDGRIMVTMDNNEKLIVSRQYAQEFKRKLGVK